MTHTASNPLLLVSADGEAITARLRRPSLTAAEAPALGRELAALLDGRRRPVVTIDLAGVTFLGSSAVGLLVGFNSTVRSAGGWLSLANPSPDVRRVFAVCRLVRMFHLEAGAAAPTADTIRAGAYRKWDAAGRPSGDGADFWYAAESDLFLGL